VRRWRLAAAGAGLDRGIVDQTDRTRGTRYFVKPALLREAGMDLRTTLSRVQPHRLRVLILEDLDRYPDSSSAEIHRRIGPEIARRTFSRALKDLNASIGHGHHDGRWTVGA
jgi:ATP-dependent DNA helicase RecG